MNVSSYFSSVLSLHETLYYKKDSFIHGSLRSSSTVLLKGLLLSQVLLDHKSIIFVSSDEDKTPGASSVQYSDS